MYHLPGTDYGREEAIRDQPILSKPPPSRFATGAVVLVVAALLIAGGGIWFYRRTVSRYRAEQDRAKAEAAKPRPAPPAKNELAPWPGFGSQMRLDSNVETTYLLRPEEITWVRSREEDILRDSIRFAPIDKGLRVEEMSPRSIFRSRGWRTGDLIREVNGIPVRSVPELRKACDDLRAGRRDNLRVQLDREGKSLVYTYRLMPPPPEPPPLPRRGPILEDFQCAAYEPEYHEELFASSQLSYGDQADWSIAQEEVDWILFNLEKVLAEFKAVPVRSKGLRIESLNESSVLAARGLQEGDVLQKFNGATIDSMEALRAAIEKLQTAPGNGLQIELEREGRPVRAFYRPGGRGSFFRINASPLDEIHRTIMIGYLYGMRRILDPILKANSSFLTQHSEYLRNAVAFRRKGILLFLLEKGSNVNDGRQPPLLTASALKPPDPGLVKLLLDRGARVDIADAEERSPVALACREDALETVKLLVDKGAEIDPRDKAGWTPLMIAVSRRNAAMVDLLISRKANVKAATPQGDSIVALAIVYGSLPILKAVIDGGGTVEGFPNTDLFVRAAGKGSVETLSYLKERDLIGADRTPGLEPLTAAIRSGRLEAVRWVLQEGVDSRREGFAALLAPLVWEGRPGGTPGIAKALVDDRVAKGGTLDDPDREYATAALEYRARGMKEFADYLLEKGAPDLRYAGKGDRALNRRLIESVTTGTARAVQAALEEGADPESCDGHGVSALILAAERGRTDVLELLLEKGANVGNKGPYGVTALFRAAERGYARAVTVLLKKGADAKARTHGQTLLDRIHNQGYPWVEFLLRQAGTVESPLPGRAASASKSYATEEEARRSQELLEAIDRKNATDVVSSLTMGADPAVRGRQGWPALSWAVETGRFDIVAALVSKGAPLDPPGDQGETPVMRAVDRRFLEIAEYLVMKGADVDAGDERSETLLMKILRSEQTGLAPVVIEKTKFVNAKDRAGWTALHLAASQGQSDLVKSLVDRGGDVKAKATEGSTALSLAAKAGHADVVEFLADRGANVDEPASEYDAVRNWTPLMRASAAGHEEVVRVLLRKKANVLYRNAQGQSALSVARTNQHDAIVELLQKAGAR